MSIFSDLHRIQNQEPQRENNVVGDLIDKKSINYEQVLSNVKDTLINWSRDLLEIKTILDSKDRFFNTKDNDISPFISTIKGDLFELNNWGVFNMDHIYDLFKELNNVKGCPDPSPLTGSNNTCHVIIRELDDKRSIIRSYNTRLKKFKREFDDVWGLLLSVQTNNKDDRYILYTTGTTFTSFSNAVTTLKNNYNNMKSTDGKLISEDTGNSLIGNNPFNDNLSNSKINISSIS